MLCKNTTFPYWGLIILGMSRTYTKMVYYSLCYKVLIFYLSELFPSVSLHMFSKKEDWYYTIRYSCFIFASQYDKAGGNFICTFTKIIGTGVGRSVQFLPVSHENSSPSSLFILLRSLLSLVITAIIWQFYCHYKCMYVCTNIFVRMFEMSQYILQ